MLNELSKEMKLEVTFSLALPSSLRTQMKKIYDIIKITISHEGSGFQFPAEESNTRINCHRRTECDTIAIASPIISL